MWKRTSVTNEDWNQAAYLRSLIKVFDVRMIKILHAWLFKLRPVKILIMAQLSKANDVVS